MSKICTMLGITLLVIISSVTGNAKDFPAIDANRVQEKMERVNQSFLLKSRKGTKSLSKNPTLVMQQKSASQVKMNASVAPNVEGLQIYNATEDYGKWWKFDTETATSAELWYNSFLAGYNINCGWVRNGTIYAVSQEIGYILTFDLETGEYKNYISLYGYSESILWSAYDKGNDITYVYTYTEDGQNLEFKKYNPDGGGFNGTFESIRVEQGEGSLATDPLVAMEFNPLDGYIYAVTLYNENWIRINPANGEWTVVKKLDFSPAGFVQAMVYTPATFSFSYVGIDVNEYTYHLVIDPATGNITSKTRMYDEAEYAIMYCSDEALQKDAPMAPEILSAEINPATMSGKIKVAVPDKTTGGTDLSGTLTLVMTIDGVEYTTKEVEVGAEVELSIENQSEGTHKLGVYCTTPDGQRGGVAEKEFFMGYDTPLAPQNVVMTETLVTWDLVTKGKYGQQMESDVITYNVYVDGQKVNDEPITTNSIELNKEFAELKRICAEVEAVCGSKISDRSKSNEVVVGSYSLPLELDITKDMLSLITVVNANNDDKTWGWSDQYNAFAYNYNSDMSADDWAIFPKANFAESMQLYTINVDVSCYSVYPERFEIGISKTGKVEDMIIVVPATDVASDDPITLGAQFKLEEAGNYYIGVHAISDADCYHLDLHKLTVQMTEAPNTVPQACEDIIATPAEYGELEATVEFTMPTKALNEELLDAEKDITIHLQSKAGSATVTGKPGERVSGVVKTEQGINVINLTPENEFGFGLGSSVTVYTGVDVPNPAELTSVRVSADNRTVTFSWETSTVGKNGGFVDPAYVTYNVLIYYPSADYWFLEAGPIDATEYSYTIEEGTSLETVSLAVTSMNIAGYMEEGPMVIAALGKPYDIPMLETFENQNLKYSPLAIEHPTEECSGTWTLGNPVSYVSGAKNATSSALIASATKEGNTQAQIALPKFNPQSNYDVQVKVRAYLYEGMADAVVSARGFENTCVLGTISMEGYEEGWHEFVFTLPEEVKEQQWSELVITASFASNVEYFMIDKYEITIYNGVETEFASETKIYAEENAIVVENVNVGEEISIYTPDGKIIMTEKADNSMMEFEINAGIYIVRCGAMTQKVVVR